METRHEELVADLCRRMGPVKPLPEEEDFFDNIETLMRFLKARDWDVDEAEKLLKATVEWRRTYQPLHVDCSWCHEKPGFHSVRQIGFDEIGRPVIYACFAQASTHKYTVEDSLAHVTYLIENAKVTMAPGIHQWVFVMDCSGMTLSACSPKLGYGLTQVMSNYYPERLGLVICVNHNPVFQGVWKAFKVFLHPNTVAKMQLVRSKKKIRSLFEKHFSEELTEWLTQEIKLNKQSKIVKSQMEFWKKPSDPKAHDPRGTASYIRDYIEVYDAGVSVNGAAARHHKPHPNIVDTVQGNEVHIGDTSLDTERRRAVEEAANFDGSDENSDFEDLDVPETLDIPEDEQIPKDAKPFQSGKTKK